MKNIHAPAFLLAFLTACTTAPKARERDSLPLADGGSAAASATASPEISRTYRSARSICFDGALKLCRDRDYRVVDQQPSASISAQAPSFSFTLTFSRTPENRTRVDLRRTPESRDEASRLLDQLGDTLLEPRQ
jgi:hypothetical protein